MNPPFDNSICLCLGAAEALRRLGVPSTDIFFVAEVVAAEGKVGVAFYENVLPIAPCPLTIEARIAEWARAVHWWNDPKGDIDARMALYSDFIQSVNRLALTASVQLSLRGVQRA